MIWLRKYIDFRFFMNVIILLFIQVAIANRILVKGHLDWYFQEIVSVNLLRTRVVPIFTILVIALLILNYGRVSYNRWLYQWSWSALEHGRGLRILVMLSVLTLTWAFVSYGFNYYYNQPHYLDRLLLVILAILVYINPIFAIPFVMIAYVISSQFMFPIGFSYTDKQILFEFIALFGCFIAVRPFTRGRTVDFIFVGLCMIGAYYYFPGIAKLHVGANNSLNWITDNNLHHYVVFTYEKGWLSFRSQELVYAMTDIVEFLRVPLQLFTVIMEIGALFILLLQRRGVIVILLSAILLHTGIMLSSGIFFWKWMVLDGAMAWFIWRYGQEEEIALIFKRFPVALSLIIIASGTLFFDVIHLGWWNTSVHTHYEFKVIDTQGNEFDWAYSQLQPYDLTLTQNRLHFVNDNKTITGTSGESRDIQIYQASLSLTLDDVPEFIEAYGNNRYTAVNAERLKDLLREYAYNMNTNYQSFFLPSIIQPPLHIGSQLFTDAYNFEYPITEVQIWAVVSFYDGDIIHIISDEEIDSVSITIPD